MKYIRFRIFVHFCLNGIYRLWSFNKKNVYILFPKPYNIGNKNNAYIKIYIQYLKAKI